jgi:hypothetical protein
VPEDQMDAQVLERLENDRSHVESSAKIIARSTSSIPRSREKGVFLEND